jgi:hypothetical protein
MDAASHMLSQVVSALEVAIAIGAVEVLVMAFVLLVIITSVLETETSVASFTFVRPLPVIQSIHVLGTSTPGVEASIAGVTLVAAHGVLKL